MPPPSKASKYSPSSPAAASAAFSHRLHQMVMGVICFVAGAAIMVIEISANRLLAPDFGSSLYTWTALIGVILVSFSVGGFLGGWWADKWRRLSLLGFLLTGAAVFTMLIPVLSAPLAGALANSGLISGPTCMSMMLFTIPGVLLGAVSPASVRLFSLEGHDAHVGIAAGAVSMLGSLGSFVGTFLSGFVLLAHFGVKTIFLGTGVALLLLALPVLWIAREKIKTRGALAGVGLAAFLWGWFTQPVIGKEVLFQKDTFYHRLEVFDQNGSRYLKLDSTMEGGMRIQDGGLVLDYQQYWQLARMDDDLKLRRALFIGAGAFGMPEQVARLGKDVNVDVVEIDPAVIDAGRSYFKLGDFPNIHAHASDARRFLQHADAKYDLIFGDAYNGQRHIPAHLVTKEFFESVRAHLSPHGVFLMNVISSIQGDQAELLGAILGTLRAAFSGHVEVFGVGGDRTEAQNVILLASMDSWKPWLEDRYYPKGSPEARLASTRVPATQWPEFHEDRPITDDWNPVDAIIARQLRR